MLTLTGSYDNTGQRSALADTRVHADNNTAHDNGDTADPGLLDGGH